MTFSITSAFDSGNIRVLSIQGHEAELEIEADKSSDFYQWFHFRIGNAAGRDLVLRITNVAGSAYPLGWPDYRARISADRENWRQADTSYADKVLTIRVRPNANAVWVAYFAPYSLERHFDLIARMAASPGVTQRELAQTLDGRPLDCLTMGQGPRQVWLYARQHPGESMAEWWMEGALEKADRCGRRDGAGAAGKGDVQYRAEHEPGRQLPRASAHQRRRREPQPGMARADRGAQPGSAGGPQRDGRDRRRLCDGRAWRRSDPRQFHRRLRRHSVLQRGKGGSVRSLPRHAGRSLA
jgi:hypothetical protein